MREHVARHSRIQQLGIIGMGSAVCKEGERLLWEPQEGFTRHWLPAKVTTKDTKGTEEKPTIDISFVPSVRP